MEQLRFWAEGNLILLSGTMWYLFITLWNTLVMLEYPEVMVLPAWTRIVPFALSIIWLSYYFSGIVVEVHKLLNGQTWTDTVEEIFFAYVLWISTPTALTEASFVVNMVMHTDDICVTCGEQDEPDESDEEDESEDEDDRDERDRRDKK